MAMIYFFLWVAFLLLVILAVPIASMLEKRRAAAAYRSSGEPDYFDDAEADPGEMGAAVAEAEEPVAEADAFGGGGDEALQDVDFGDDAFG